MSRAGSIEADSEVVRIRGLEVAVRVRGDGHALLLINGTTRPLQSWESFAQALSGRLVVSFDAPGVGASPTPLMPLSIPALAELAAAVLDAAGADEADVLGFSHGGAVAQQLAAEFPGRVRRLVLVSTSCGVGATPGRRRSLRSLAMPRDIDAWPFPDPWGLLWHSLAFSSWSSIPFLGAIEAPTLVVCGTHDRFVPPENSRALAGRIPDASLVMIPGGHDLQRPQQAKALALIVEQFLRQPSKKGHEHA